MKRTVQRVHPVNPIHRQIKTEAARAVEHHLGPIHADDFPGLTALLKYVRYWVRTAKTPHRVRSVQYHGKRYRISQLLIGLRVHDPDTGQPIVLGPPEF